MSQPNILFIMTDQQRWDAMSCSGSDWLRTPHMDWIAAEGVRFTNCVTTSPVCIPARVTLASGQYPHTTGVWNNCTYTLAPETPTWMAAIRDAGYRTSLFGKTHLHPHGSDDLRDQEHLLHAYGLDDVDEIGGPRASARVGSYMTDLWQKKGQWQAYQEDYADRFATKPYVVRPSALPLEDYADCYVGRRAAEYLAAYDREQPWFCWVSFGGPHEPWDTPEPYASRYRPEDMPVPARRFADSATRPSGGIDAAFSRGGAVARSAEDMAACRADYAGNVSLIDDQIGQLLATVEARGELDNTVILFTSDHGELNGDHGLIYKGNFLDGAVRVPLLLRVPGEAGGTVCTSPVELVDVGPTLVELAGGALRTSQEGVSLTPAVADPAAQIREYAISELDHEVMILTERWKLAVNTQGAPYLLFDRVADPEESRNLAGDAEFAKVANELLQFLKPMMIMPVLSLRPAMP
jgi:choline-sulfatase